MYRNQSDYNEIVKLVTEIYIDYDIRIFPVDPKDICRKLGVALVAYSEFDEEQRKLLEKNQKMDFLLRGVEEIHQPYFTTTCWNLKGEFVLRFFMS